MPQTPMTVADFLSWGAALQDACSRTDLRAGAKYDFSRQGTTLPRTQSGRHHRRVSAPPTTTRRNLAWPEADQGAAGTGVKTAFTQARVMAAAPASWA